ncbi:MAG: tRNA (guanosine(37)-N1)-methyltransferase TrmD [Desulfobacteraceae bacterium 4572_19]|nr:MAG: tRNA (guanosine(37)-N1)-methyltransferase TrmD [Desulfobacteraceae bacterium 4572_19]
MFFDVLTIFPEMFDSFRENGMIRLAIERDLILCNSINIRDFASGKHRVTDDRPYGGGCGMVMKPAPLAGAIRYSVAKCTNPEKIRTVLLTPQGRPFSQQIADEFSQLDGLVLVCGRYEGVDERVCDKLVDDEISIGDYVMTGGELAAMVIIDSVARLIPGVLGGEESACMDSFQNGLLEHAHYTRPDVFENRGVPDVLLSGNHAEIEKWRFETSLKRTFLKRPDLLVNRELSNREKNILKNWCCQLERIIES